MKRNLIQKNELYPHIQLSMGMIDPDYVHINHFLQNPEDDTEESSVQDLKKEEDKHSPRIQVHFRSRQE
ncbi:hypothetical protein SAMN04487866_11830 [Thermoactinomyces sp. DSM 45891]|uniref:hypothetical protein n=1 Tax=Thermoactinomyces sp. DSM 45891 TaxID=1761907 RepID=UPI00091495A8|nr:hypothetical protein [Thermoactinomyces sp. DSM 45891]SFX69675.1 hypothetical protein SAMN04487866_11830 [Thermoactinomyces sp. DSM 45891]